MPVRTGIPFCLETGAPANQTYTYSATFDDVTAGWGINSHNTTLRKQKDAGSYLLSTHFCLKQHNIEKQHNIDVSMCEVHCAARQPTPARRQDPRATPCAPPVSRVVVVVGGGGDNDDGDGGSDEGGGDAGAVARLEAARAAAGRRRAWRRRRGRGRQGWRQRRWRRR